MSADWLKNRGAITVCGDSTARGDAGGTAGWIGKTTAVLTADGYHHAFVGNIITGAIGAWAVSGTGIAYFRNAGTAPLAAQIVTQRSAILILAIGWNDWRGNIGRSQATHRAELEALIDEVLAAAPWVSIRVTQLPLGEAGDTGAWPLANLAAFNGEIVTWNTVTCPAMVANYVASGRRMRCVGPFSNPVRDAGHTHPIDGPTGYDLMAVPVVADLEAAA